MSDLLKAALRLSDSLHLAEVRGVNLPWFVEKSWRKLTIEIEAIREQERKNGKPNSNSL